MRYTCYRFTFFFLIALASPYSYSSTHARIRPCVSEYPYGASSETATVETEVLRRYFNSDRFAWAHLLEMLVSNWDRCAFVRVFVLISLFAGDADNAHRQLRRTDSAGISYFRSENVETIIAASVPCTRIEFETDQLSTVYKTNQWRPRVYGKSSLAVEM